MDRDNAGFIFLIMAIVFVIWMEWRYRRREKNRDWREVEEISRTINNDNKLRMTRDAKKLEREAMQYVESKQKESSKKGGE